MDLFEQYQKNWKQGKANPNSNPLSNLKNKEIMDHLIRYEQEETKQIKKGIIGASIGIFSGLGCALTAMFIGDVTVTSSMILGIVLVLFSLFFLAYNSFKKVPLLASSQTSTNYLQQVKERLITRNIKMKKHTTFYIVMVMLGTGLFTSMLPYFVVGAIVFGGVNYFFGDDIWNTKNREASLVKQLTELDQKMSDLK